jgi:hypothetical protein
MAETYCDIAPTLEWHGRITIRSMASHWTTTQPFSSG